MRKRLVAALVVLNVALFGLAVNHARLAADQPVGWFSCCRSDTGGQGFCCANCCFFFPNCDTTDDCNGE